MSTSYPRSNVVRIALALVGAFGALFLAWWVPLICMILLSLRWAAWEVLMIGLFMDFLWLPGSGSGGFHLPFFTIGGIALVWMCAPLRAQFLMP
jgi:hypothetical protein